MSEKEKFFERIETLKQKFGLKWVQFETDNISDDVKEEEMYAELNRMHAARDLADVEVLGKYSPPLIETSKELYRVNGEEFFKAIDSLERNSV